MYRISAGVPAAVVWFPRLVLGMLLLSCAPPGRGGGGDGGGGGGQGGSGGKGGGSGGGPGGCAPGELVCSGNEVRRCDGSLVERCPAGCSGGRCVSSACAAAEAKRSFVGCLFYMLDMDNTPFDDKMNDLVIVGNPSASATATVKLESRTPGGPWTPSMTMTLPPGSVDVFLIADRHLEDPGKGVALAYRISSDEAVVAYGVQSDDADRKSLNVGGTILYPAHVLGTSYMPIAYAQDDVGSMTWDENGPAGQIAVVGTRDGTKVTFEVGAKGSTLAGGGVPALGPGESFDLTLDDGDVLQIFSAKKGDDLTGSLITAGSPVAVFSGNISTSYGRTYNLVPNDMTHEQMLPLAAWGKTYIATRQYPGGPYPAKCRELFVNPPPPPPPNVSIWRVLASENGTEVTFDAGSGVSGVPRTPVSLGRGQFTEFESNGDFVVSASKPILVAQFIDCEQGMALAPSAEQLLSDFLFAVPPNFYEHQVNIVRKLGAPVTLDGTALAAGQFKAVGAGFEVARLNLPQCKGKSCGHRIQGSEIGVALRGQDNVCGYVFSAGIGVRCVNATAGCR